MTPKIIFQIVCDILKVSISDVLSQVRWKELICAKKIYCYVCREDFDWSERIIGLEVNLDHATVHYHHKVLKDFIKYDDKEYINLIADVRADIAIKRLELKTYGDNDYNRLDMFNFSEFWSLAGYTFDQYNDSKWRDGKSEEISREVIFAEWVLLKNK
jgi:hypothetical protein